MLLLILLPLGLGLVVVSAIGLAGFGPLTGDRRAERDGVLGAVGPALGLLAGFLALGVGVVGALVMGGVEEEGDSSGEPRQSTTAPASSKASPESVPTTSTTTSEARDVGVGVTLGPTVRIEADDSDTFPTSYDVADRLRPESVLTVYALGFEPFARASARQCTTIRMRGLRCANQIPVQIDADGEARFQYLVTADFLPDAPDPDRCRANATPCTIVVDAFDDGGRGEIQTIFSDELPPAGSIRVSRTTGLSLDGETVTVEVHDYPVGAEVTAMLCAAPDASGSRCGAPGPTAPLVVGRDGAGSTELVIEPGPVGERRAACARGDDCGISVVSDEVFARAPVVPITFAAPPGATYDPTRLLLGLLIAVVLVAIAAWLIVRSDWSAVGEAAAPEIDNAEYADLDAIIAALPPEEDDELVSVR
jgi:hypothetical protein